MMSHRSLSEAQAGLEEVDVENAEYEAWDAAGTPLMLGVQESIWLRIQPVSAPEPQQLAEAISEFARARVCKWRPRRCPRTTFSRHCN